MSALSLLDRHRHIFRMRCFDEAVVEAVKTGDITGEMHVAIGQEAVAAGMIGQMREGDALVSTHRSHYHALAKGVPMLSLAAELLHRETGLCRGRGGHMHLFDQTRRFCTSGIVGASIPVALGYAFEAWFRGGDDVAIAITGDGAVATGSFHESFNLAAVWHLPLVVVCENNQYGISVPVSETSPTATLSTRATGYGAWGDTVDGMDVEAVAEAFAAAVAHVREGHGPALLEAVVYRFRGHFEGDLDLYRPEAEKLWWREERDPVLVTRNRLLERGTPQAEIDRVESDVRAEVADAFNRAKQQPRPDPAEAASGVFVEAGVVR